MDNNKKSAMQQRKIARDSAFKLVYEYLFQKKFNATSLAIFTSEDISPKEKDYIVNVYNGVVEHYDELIAIVIKYAEKFTLDRVFRADLAALLVAIYEMKYMDDIPLSVSINEAVELVKTYSTEKSNQFVNGILSSVYKELTFK